MTNPESRLNKQQKQLLFLLYKFRFLTINQLLKYFNHKYPSRIRTWLKELVELGKMYYAITQYKQGKISIGKTAELAGVNLAELMDTLTSLGIKSNLDVEDYLEGKKYAQKVI